MLFCLSNHSSQTIFQCLVAVYVKGGESWSSVTCHLSMWNRVSNTSAFPLYIYCNHVTVLHTLQRATPPVLEKKTLLLLWWTFCRLFFGLHYSISASSSSWGLKKSCIGHLFLLQECFSTLAFLNSWLFCLLHRF